MVTTDDQSAYILHRRPYRETSLLVDLFARDVGRLGVVARGARRARLASQPFVPLTVAWAGRGTLKTLIRAEPAAAGAFSLAGPALYLGFYANELLVRLLPEWDPHPALYDAYERLLGALGKNDAPEPLLRRFELSLLSELGYGFALDVTAEGVPVIAEARYCYVPGTGLLSRDGVGRDNGLVLRGHHLLAMAADDYRDPDTRRSAKRLLRLALSEHLGPRPLRSRDLFRRSVLPAGPAR